MRSRFPGWRMFFVGEPGPLRRNIRYDSPTGNGANIESQRPLRAGLTEWRRCSTAVPSRRGVNQPRSVGREAVEQAGATGAFERILPAPARAVRGVPGIHVSGVLQPGTVMMADDGR